MIIRHPTALYKTQIPQKEESGSVTWTISTDDPEETPGPLFLQISIANELTKRSDKFFDDKIRRTSYGDLISTVTNSSSSSLESGKKQYEVGDILEFSEDDTPVVAPALVPNIVDIIHNTNILNLSDLGLSETDIENITDESRIRFSELRNQYNDLKMQLNNVQKSISNNQKLINEAEKSIKAVELIFVGSTDQDVLDRLVDKRDQLLEERDQLVIENDEIAANLTETYQSIVDISQLIR